MGDFFGILLFFGGIIFIFLLLSKISGFSIGYRNKGAFVRPDDLDNILSSGRKLVDTKYKNEKEFERKTIEEINRINAIIDNLNFNKVWSESELKNKELDEKFIESYIKNNYDSKIEKLIIQRAATRRKYEIISGKKLPFKK